MIVAGGHSLLPMMKLRIANPEYLVDINDLAAELGYIVVEPTARCGSARWRGTAQVLESDELAAVCPIFRDAERRDRRPCGAQPRHRWADRCARRTRPRI